MTYAVASLFYTLQGEGAHSGRPAVFCRFAGCDPRGTDRADVGGRAGEGESSVVHENAGGRFDTAVDLATAISARWPADADSRAVPYVVCTGGEPLRQLDAALVEALHDQDFEIAIETHGTLRPPRGIDWICVSPSADAPLALTQGDELKLVYPQEEPEVQPERFLDLEFNYFFLQPRDGPDRRANTAATARYCLEHPRWRLSLPTHRLIDID
ncbi:MAG: 7-carboxy-7-deazaguanine synthase [Candidatus Competibacterales bacterium]|nr:7-carboxy-7-deazaguanine synthase [Candidatus Competibacterales bacterium]